MAISLLLTNVQIFNSLRNRHLAQIQIETFWRFYSQMTLSMGNFEEKRIVFSIDMYAPNRQIA
jgi:hypothetical protein